MPAPISNELGRKTVNGPNASSLEADIALLSNLLSQETDESSHDVTELLRRLEAAEGIADGVESRLDGIMDHLDSMLTELETRTTATQGEGDAKAVVTAEVDAIEEMAVVSTGTAGEAGKASDEK
ncbi:hypothetical protein NUW54_g1047 [Trametes sanguinea]|uniref:Uncharacterized protein n=1 Tax=Trametes sanguinea TaxID=158606 RepID=A0ACC1Q7F5_9APHY|nr:hypothetical protein NUW54_g1047 [Trametes sanguinea]